MEQLTTLGLFGIRENSDELDLSLDERFVPNPTSTFFFNMQGSSMAPFILEGDTLVVDRSKSIKHDTVIVASFQGRFLCRRFFYRDHAKHLISDHQSHPPLVINEQSDFVYFGRVTSFVRENL